jgi:hypothetical protein
MLDKTNRSKKTFTILLTFFPVFEIIEYQLKVGFHAGICRQTAIRFFSLMLEPDISPRGREGV